MTRSTCGSTWVGAGTPAHAPARPTRRSPGTPTGRARPARRPGSARSSTGVPAAVERHRLLERLRVARRAPRRSSGAARSPPRSGTDGRCGRGIGDAGLGRSPRPRAGPGRTAGRWTAGGPVGTNRSSPHQVWIRVQSRVARCSGVQERRDRSRAPPTRRSSPSARRPAPRPRPRGRARSRRAAASETASVLDHDQPRPPRSPTLRRPPTPAHEPSTAARRQLGRHAQRLDRHRVAPADLERLAQQVDVVPARRLERAVDAPGRRRARCGRGRSRPRR